MKLVEDQKHLFVMWLVDGVKKVPDEIVATWEKDEDVTKWTFENRIGQAGKPVDFFAKHLKRRRLTIYKIVNGENKLSPSEASTWDKLTGWSGFEQFLAKREKEEQEVMASALQDILKLGLQPLRRAA